MMKLVATTVVMFLVMMSMQAHHGAEGRVVAVMKMNEQALLLGSSLQKGSGGTPAPNPPTHIPSSTVNQKGYAGYNAAHSPSPPSPSAHSNTLLGSSLQKGGGTPAPDPPTHIPSSTVNQKGFAGHNGAHSPSLPGPSSHSNTMQLLFSMAAATIARK